MGKILWSVESISETNRHHKILSNDPEVHFETILLPLEGYARSEKETFNHLLDTYYTRFKEEKDPSKLLILLRLNERIAYIWPFYRKDWGF